MVKKLKNKDKYNEIKAVLYCNREAIVTTKDIIKFKEKIKKLSLNEDGIIRCYQAKTFRTFVLR